jgi:hypothetical protein
MVTIKELVALVIAGSKPVITFTTNAVYDLEGYPEKGMRARIVEAVLKEDDAVAMWLDFSEFEAFNAPFESRCYRDKSGEPTLTAREYGDYKPQEKFYFSRDDMVSKYGSLDSTERLALYNQFKVDGTVSTLTSYVQWLEDQLLATRAAASPAATPTA